MKLTHDQLQLKRLLNHQKNDFINNYPIIYSSKYQYNSDINKIELCNHKLYANIISNAK